MKWTIGRKMGAMVGGLLLLILVSVAMTIYLSASTFEHAGNAREQAHLARVDYARLSARASDAQLAVVEVQESFSDVAATRALDGLDGGFQEAENAADRFRADMEAFRTYYSDHGDADHLAEIASIEESFEKYYRAGLRMARAYVQGGPTAGNPLMPELDAASDGLRKHLAGFIEAQHQQLATAMESVEESIATASSNAETQESIAEYALPFSGLAAVFLTIALLGIVRRLRAIVIVAERASKGDIEQEIDIETSDEVGELATAFRRLLAALRAHAQVATQLAHGEVATDVALLSEGDTLGKAMRMMRENMMAKTEVAHQLAKGNLAVEIKAKDSDVLGTAMLTMKENFRQVIGNMHGVVRQLAAAAPEIAATAEEAAATAVEQASTVSEVSATTEEVAETSRRTAEGAEEVFAAARGAVKDSEQGIYAVAASVSLIQELGNRSSNVRDRIHDLIEQGNKIAEIVETVSDLAEQSNLLAVNASIEAAKAGEHGKGFAVVASEVRNLAAQSKRAAQQIRSLLSDISDAGRAAMDASVEGATEAKSGAKAIETVRDVVNNLATVLNRNAELAQQIATLATDQATGMQQVFHAMTDVASAGEDSALGASRLEQAATDLAGLVKQLATLTSQYTL